MNLTLRGQQTIWVVEGDTVQTFSSDTVRSYNKTRSFLLNKIEQGFIYASIDSVISNAATTTYHLFLGSRYDVKIREIHTADPSLTKFRTQTSFDEVQSLLDRASDSGYPFAAIEVVNIETRDEKADVDLTLNYGPYIQFDTVEILSPINTKPSFIWTFLDMEPGSPFVESRLRTAPNRIRQFDFLELRKPLDLAFSGGRAKIYVDLKERMSNQFDGILGILPNQNSKNGAIITGYINLHLKNLFKSGKQVRMEWQRFGEQSQSLNLLYRHPYLFGTNLNIDGQLMILKQDSSFVNRMLRFQLDKIMFDRFLLGFDFRNENSGVVGKPIEVDLVSYQTNWYGVEFSSLNQSEITSRIRSARIKASFHFGSRSTEPVDSLGSTNTVNNLRTNLVLAGQFLMPGRGALYLKNSFFFVYNEMLLINELKRVGGLLSLRGFNENQFFVNNHWIVQTEYRYFFESNSFLNAFFDFSWLRNDVSGFEFQYWTKSFGAGMNLATSNGIFKFIFAGGFHNAQPFDLQDIKIHFGYAANF